METNSDLMTWSSELFTERCEVELAQEKLTWITESTTTSKKWITGPAGRSAMPLVNGCSKACVPNRLSPPICSI